MPAITIGFDIAKSVFQVRGEDAGGKTVIQKRLRRGQVTGFFAEPAPAPVGTETGGTAPCRGRSLRALGREVRLIPAACVEPFVWQTALSGKPLCLANRFVWQTALSGKPLVKRDKTAAGDAWAFSPRT